MALENNLLGVVHPLLFSGPGNTHSVLRGEGPQAYVTRTLQWILDDPDFRSVEITRIKDPAIRKEVKSLLQQARKDGKIEEVVYSAQPVQLLNEDNLCLPSDIASLDENERAKAVRRLCECVDEALEYSCNKFAFYSGKDPAYLIEASETGCPEIRRQALGQLRRSVHELCIDIEKKTSKSKSSLQPLLEVFDSRKNSAGGSPFKEALIGPAERAEPFMESLRHFYGRSELALMLDTSHMLIAGEGPGVLKILAPYLGHVHLANVVLNRTVIDLWRCTSRLPCPRRRDDRSGAGRLSQGPGGD